MIRDIKTENLNKNGCYYATRYSTARELAYCIRGINHYSNGYQIRQYPQSQFYRDAAERFIRLFKLTPGHSYKLKKTGYLHYSGNIEDSVRNLFCDRDEMFRGIHVHQNTRRAVSSQGYQGNAVIALDCIFYSEDAEKMEAVRSVYFTLETVRPSFNYKDSNEESTHTVAALEMQRRELTKITNMFF